MKAFLILLCDGMVSEGFQICSGVSNEILDLDSINTTKNYKELMLYLDSTPKLFDGPCVCKNNIIMNTLYKIYELGYFTEKQYQALSHFVTAHIHHGITLKIDFLE